MLPVAGSRPLTLSQKKMAHFVSLLMMPIGEVSKRHTRDSILASVVQSFGCSHFIAAHPRIRPILDEGKPIDAELWHPITSPHYHLPTNLSAAVNTLEDLENAEPDLRKDEWTLTEIHKLREACAYGVEHQLAMVVLLSNTLAKPPRKNGPRFKSEVQQNH